MYQTFKFAVLSASLLLAAFAVLAIFGFFDNLGFHGSLAAVLGIALTSAVGVGLMGLLFFSDRSRIDREVHDATTRRPDRQ
ncbi:MAG: hypothetical protein J0H65_09000 [Rhizobiales bacterium]|nr:hypothetical protein [Hyphomicrobiales bacterium]